MAPFAESLNHRFGGQPISNLAKSYGEADRLISQGGRPVGYPAHDAPEGEWEKWATANAIPEDAGAYELYDRANPPEGLNTDMMEEMAKAFHDEKTPPGLAKRLVDKYLEIDAQFAQQAQDAYLNQQHEAQKELQREMGLEYETRIKNIAAVAAAQGFDPKDPALFDNPKVVRFADKIVRLLGEDTVASMRDAAGHAGQFAGDGKYEANRIMTDTSHPDYDKYRSGDPEVAAKVNRLLSGG